MAILQVVKGQNPGQQFPLDRPTSVLGRHPDCDVVLDVQAVSRQHARILREGAHFFVEDLGSRNGTFVNGERVNSRCQLAENDRVKICNLLFTFHNDLPGAEVSEVPDNFESSAIALLVDDESASAGSTIMSKVDLKSSNTGLQVAVNPAAKLKALIEITRSLAESLELEVVLPNILESLSKIFTQADRGFVMMRGMKSGSLAPKAVWHRRPGDEDTIRISRTIVNQVMDAREAILSADAASDERFDTSQSIADFSIRSMMCAPLVNSDGEAMGVIQIDTLDQRNRFQQDDLDVLASVASQAAFVIEIAQFHETALAKQAMERDLELARKVQRGLLPESPPVVEGYEFFDFYEPANQVGGDYYGYFRLPQQRVALVVADVAGKGIPAALLMAKLSAEVGYLLVSQPSAAAALNRLNDSFCRAAEDRFVTLVLAIIDPVAHQLILANAGHMSPYMRDVRGAVEAVGDNITGVPLGVSDGFEYEQITRPFAPGDCLTLFTDGISEALNSAGDLYGLERIREQLLGAESGPSGLGRRILDNVKRFVGTQPQSDDMCLACLGRLP